MIPRLLTQLLRAYVVVHTQAILIHPLQTAKHISTKTVYRPYRELRLN